MDNLPNSHAPQDPTIAADQERVRTLIANIRGRPWKSGGDVIEKGGALYELSWRLGHNAFVTCIDVEFGLPFGKAQKCISAYWEFRDCAAARLLSPSTLLKLSDPALPSTIRAKVRASWKQGYQLTETEIQGWVIDARENVAREKRAAKELRARSFKPRAVRARRIRERQNSRLLDHVCSVLNNLPRDDKVAVADFVWKADVQKRKALAVRLAGFKRFYPSMR